jgi:hypothetical protein
MNAPPALLRLRAEDTEDMQVISAILQDAIVPVYDICFTPDEKNFIMVVHRLRREAVDANTELERICCAVNIKGVDNVQTHKIDLFQQGQMLDLLALMPEDPDTRSDQKSQKMLGTFIFAGDSRIRLELSNWSMIIEDFGEAWPASCTPCHDQESA